MNSSFLYHAFGVKDYHYHATAYKKPLLLVKHPCFLPKLLVLGSILDGFLCFLPRLLEIICTFAPSKHQNREGYGIL